MESNQCVVVFPVYKSLDEQEIRFVKQGITMTPDYKHVFIAPESFIADSSFDEFSAVETVRFEDRFFRGLEGYNRLMLSKQFYQRFRDFEYILIHQTDAYLFKPELTYWCGLGYDYIGAPWLDPEKKFKSNLRKMVFELIESFFFAKSENCIQYLKVGNGGLSLRRTASFMDVLEKVPAIPFFLYKKALINSFNEDLFWGVMACKIKKNFTTPDWKKALGFAMETRPAYAYQQNENQLPFGCHAINKHDPAFWRSYIQNK